MVYQIHKETLRKGKDTGVYIQEFLNIYCNLHFLNNIVSNLR